MDCLFSEICMWGMWQCFQKSSEHVFTCVMFTREETWPLPVCLCAACSAREGLYGAIARWKNCLGGFKMLTFTSGFSMVKVKAKQERVWFGKAVRELSWVLWGMSCCIWQMASVSWLPPPQPTARNGFLIGEGSLFCSFGTNPGQVLSGKLFYIAYFFNLWAVFLARVYKLHLEWIWVSLGARPWQHW